MKRFVALTAAMLILAGLSFSQTMANQRKIAHVSGGVRWSQCAFGPDGILHVIFEEDSDRGHPIWYVRFDGTTASTPFNVTGSLDIRGERPGITVSSRGVIAVGWGVDVGDVIYVRLYEPRTKSWGEVETVAAGYGWDEPQLAVESDGTVHCFFFNDAGGRAYVATRTNGVWGAPIRLSAGYGKQGGVAVGPNNTVWALWREKNNIYKNYYSSRPHGGNWASGELLTSSGGSTSHPSITVGPDNIAIAAWGDIDMASPNGAEIRLMRIGTGEARQIAIQKFTQHFPKVAVDTNLKIHVASQRGGGDFGDGAFYYNNVSGSWAEPQTLTTSMDKVVGLSADPYGNVALCLSDMLAGGAGADIYIWSTQPIIPRIIYPPTNLAAVISLKKVRTAPGITYNLSWSGNSANNDTWISGYNIYVKEGDGDYQLLLSVNKSTLAAAFTYSDMSQKRKFAIATTNPGGGESDLVEF
jgi:hypothetical protein